MKKRFIWIVAILILAGLYYFSTTKTSDKNTAGSDGVKVELDGPVKLGGLLPLSGDAISYGTPIQRATIMALDEINASGGIAGEEVEIVWEDGKCEPKESSSAVQKLISIDGVKYILGGACSSEVLAGAELAEENQVIILSPSATSPDISDAGQYVFRTAPSDALQGRVAAEYAFNTLGLTSAAVISENTDYAQALREVFKSSFTKLGGKIVADETYESSVVDFTSQVLKIKNAKPDVIYMIPQTDAPGSQIVKQLKENNVEAQFMGGEIFSGRDLLENNAALLEGLIATEPFFDDTSEKAAAFLAKYEELYGEKAPFPYFMAAAYENVFILKDTIEANGLNTESAKDWIIENIQSRDSIIGTISFDKNGDVSGSYNIFEVKSGKAETLEVYTPNN